MDKWQLVSLNPALKGETFTSGSGYYEKEYIYINIPTSDKYDHYCFAISTKLVDAESSPDFLYINLCLDAEYTLQKALEYRGEGKRYKRYKMCGKELYEAILEECEDDYFKQWQQDTQRKEQNRIKRENKVMGHIVYGHYKGNTYGQWADISETFFFENTETKTYFNKHHDKVSNVVVKYRIEKPVSKAYFREIEPNIFEKLNKWKWLKRTLEMQENLLSALEEKDLLRNEILKTQELLKKEVEEELNRQLQYTF